MKKMKGRALLGLITIFLLGIGGWVNAEFVPPIKEAVIYPDGLAFLVREGETELPNGECLIDLLPPALSGSLSVFSTTPGLSVEQITSFRDSVIKEEMVNDLGELFQENIGQPIQLLINGEVVSGVIKGYINPAYLIITVVNQNGVRTDEVYPMEMITSFLFVKPIKLNKERTENIGKLKINFKGTGLQASYPVGISYLQSGISWSPEYTINLLSENSGELSFSAVVRNDVDDLTGATLYFAEKGAQFLRELSPLAIFTEEQVTPAFRGVLTEKGVKRDEAFEFIDSGVDNLSSLIMYKKTGINLRKGERAILPLFRGAVQVEPIYRLELSRSVYSERVAVEPVWKGYRIYNNSPVPWIEGRVMITTMGNRPLGVRNFPYILPDKSGEIQVMTVQDIKANVLETEFERVQGSMVFQEKEYSFVRIRGEIELENTKNEEVKVKVTHLVPGEVSAVGEGGTSIKRAVLGSGPNPSTEITWEILISPQSSRKLTYTYQTYLPLGYVK
jgi:hypothetical protein